MGFWAAAIPAIAGAAGSIWNNLSGQDKQDRRTNEQLNQQREFAQQGIRWRVNDAKKAGIHPLAALGANTMSFSPVSVGGPPSLDLAQHGQNISRAMMNKLTPQEKALSKIRLEQEMAKLKNMNLQNVGLQHELDKLNQISMPTQLEQSKPISGIAGQNAIKYVPNEIPVSKGVGVTSGIQPMTTQAINEHGTVYNVPSQSISEALESDIATQFKFAAGKIIDYVKGYVVGINPNKKWFKSYKNMLRRTRPKSNDPNYEFRYNVVRGSFVLRKKKGRSQFFDHSRLKHIK